ncbi:MAG: hypothetical protein WCG08_16510 [Paludibacter sp.]
MPEIENYIVLKNVDSSIQVLNPIISNYGLEFVIVDTTLIISDFLDFFKPRTLNNGNITIQSIISDIYSGPLGRDLSIYGCLVFIKEKQNNFLSTVDNSGDGHIKLMSYLVNLHKKEDEWITKLRLLGKGDIGSFAGFQMIRETRECINQQHLMNPLPFGELYAINSDLSERASLIFSQNLFKREYIRNSLIYFNLTYSFTDLKAKFLNLMISLECIFNSGKDQISHTISRHIAIILSTNKEEFATYYKQCKKLYNLRSQIVHGQKVLKDEDIKESLEILQSFVRSIIIYCVNLDLEKDLLFEKLNYMGFITD